jgi:hypothetical protein
VNKAETFAAELSGDLDMTMEQIRNNVISQSKALVTPRGAPMPATVHDPKFKVEND